jgi:hypothetical protein
VQQEPWINRPKPKTDVPEPNPGNGTAEQLKATIEIIALALQTDSTRAITLSSGFANGDFGLNGGYHGFSHHGERPDPVAALKKIEGYQIQMMSYLIDLLKAQEDSITPLSFTAVEWPPAPIRRKTFLLFSQVAASNMGSIKSILTTTLIGFPLLISCSPSFKIPD